MLSNDDLGAQIERYVDQLIQSGRFTSRSAVLREGVRLIERRETELAALDAALAKGIADAEAGRVIPIEDVAARLRAKYEKLAEADGK